MEKKRVLVCDDANFMRMMIKDILIKNGYEIVGEAANGMKAVELYIDTFPDVVTMDITMPDVTGLQALENIMMINPDARVIMCSAMGQEGMMIQAIRAGARDFIVKPFREERVLEALHNAIG